MNNTRLTNVLLILLVLFNLAFVAMWWMGHKKMHHPMKDAPVETTTLMHDRTKGEVFLVKTLGLDTVQQKKLDNIMAVHFDYLDKNMSVYKRIQSNLFNSLKNSIDTSYASRCADSLGVLKVAMTQEFYAHFASIKTICNTGQQKQFDDIIDSMSKEFLFHHDFSNNNTKGNHDSL